MLLEWHFWTNLNPPADRDNSGFLGLTPPGVEKPVDPVGEPSQRCQVGQVFQYTFQVISIRLGEVFSTLHDQAPMFEAAQEP